MTWHTYWKPFHFEGNLGEVYEFTISLYTKITGSFCFVSGISQCLNQILCRIYKEMLICLALSHHYSYERSLNKVIGLSHTQVCWWWYKTLQIYVERLKGRFICKLRRRFTNKNNLTIQVGNNQVNWCIIIRIENMVGVIKFGSEMSDTSERKFDKKILNNKISGSLQLNLIGKFNITCYGRIELSLVFDILALFPLPCSLYRVAQ